MNCNWFWRVIKHSPQKLWPPTFCLSIFCLWPSSSLILIMFSKSFFVSCSILILMIISSDMLLIEKKGLSNLLIGITYLLSLRIKLSLSITLPSSYCSSPAQTFANFLLLLSKWGYAMKGLLLSNLWWTFSPETWDLSNDMFLFITLNCFDDMSSIMLCA